MPMRVPVTSIACPSVDVAVPLYPLVAGGAARERLCVRCAAWRMAWRVASLRGARERTGVRDTTRARRGRRSARAALGCARARHRARTLCAAASRQGDVGSPSRFLLWCVSWQFVLCVCVARVCVRGVGVTVALRSPRRGPPLPPPPAPRPRAGRPPWPRARRFVFYDPAQRSFSAPTLCADPLCARPDTPRRTHLAVLTPHVAPQTR